MRMQLPLLVDVSSAIDVWRSVLAAGEGKKKDACFENAGVAYLKERETEYDSSSKSFGFRISKRSRFWVGVGHEAADGRVGYRGDVLLRRPLGPHQTPVLGPLQEPFREQLVEVGIRRVRRLRTGRRRTTEYPQEAVTALLEGVGGDLSDLRRGEATAYAPKAEQHDGRRRLCVEPPHALVYLLLLLAAVAGRGRLESQDGAYRVDGP